MTIAWPEAAVLSLARRRAVILIGSGVSANARAENGMRPPTWGLFLTEANKRLPKKRRYIGNALKRYNYLEACEYLKKAHGEKWKDIIADSFSTPKYKPAKIHEAIFNLDARIVISMNFDKIYDTYASSASQNTVIVKNYYDPDIRQAVSGDGRYIIKPHGTIDSISTMIFTLEDYASARIKYASFYEVISSLLHTHTFICIGCGLSDPDMKLIFEDYRYKYSESPHYILLASGFSDEECDMMRRTRGLNVIRYSSANDHNELTEGIVALSNTVTSRREDLSVSQNW